MRSTITSIQKEKDIITGIVQRYVGNNINVSLDDKTETIKSLRWFRRSI